MLVSSRVSNTCLFAPVLYDTLNKGFFLGFLFKPLEGLLKQEILGEVSFFITYLA